MPDLSSVRILPEDIVTIRDTFRTFFDKEDKIWIFGSRVDPLAKGGDIDLYIETKFRDPEKIAGLQLDFSIALKSRLGDQKIDIIVNSGDIVLPIHHRARTEGICLV